MALLCVAIAGFSVNLQAQSLDKILKSHFEVVGQDKLEKMENMKVSGKVVVQGGLMELPMTYFMTRSGSSKTESTFQGQSFIEAYDGATNTGWTVNPFMGAKDPQKVPAEQAKRLKQQADMDGMLYDYKAKGYTVTLEGTEDFEGAPVHKIKIVTEDKDTHYYFMDAENFVLVKSESTVMDQGNEIKTATFFSNYKEVDGIMSPFSMETKMDGKTVSQVVFEKIEWNVELADNAFAMPAASAGHSHSADDGHDHSGHSHATDVKDAPKKACGANCKSDCCAGASKKSCGEDCTKACCAGKAAVNDVKSNVEGAVSKTKAVAGETMGKKKACGADCKSACCADKKGASKKSCGEGCTKACCAAPKEGASINKTIDVAGETTAKKACDKSKGAACCKNKAAGEKASIGKTVEVAGETTAKKACDKSKGKDCCKSKAAGEKASIGKTVEVAGETTAKKACDKSKGKDCCKSKAAGEKASIGKTVEVAGETTAKKACDKSKGKDCCKSKAAGEKASIGKTVEVAGETTAKKACDKSKGKDCCKSKAAGEKASKKACADGCTKACCAPKEGASISKTIEVAGQTETMTPKKQTCNKSKSAGCCKSKGKAGEKASIDKTVEVAGETTAKKACDKSKNAASCASKSTGEKASVEKTVEVAGETSAKKTCDKSKGKACCASKKK